MTSIKNDGGNRALVAYVYGDFEIKEYLFREAVFSVLKTPNIGDFFKKTISDPRTVNVALSSGDWLRALKIGNCSGELLVGVYFYTAPTPPEPDPDANPDVEPEPAPSITSLVCNALQAAFPDGKVGASAFVISPEQIDFELDVE